RSRPSPKHRDSLLPDSGQPLPHRLRSRDRSGVDLDRSHEGQPACQEKHGKKTLQRMLVHLAILPKPRNSPRPSWPEARGRDNKVVSAAECASKDGSRAETPSKMMALRIHLGGAMPSIQKEDGGTHTMRALSIAILIFPFSRSKELQGRDSKRRALTKKYH